MDYTCPRHGYTSGDDRNAIRGPCCIPVAVLDIETSTGYMLDALCAIPNTLPEFDRITNDDGTVESDDDYIRRVQRLRQRATNVVNPTDLAELVAAARAVVETYQEEIPGVGEMTTDVIERLRKALP